jgi:hypothetical protein
MSPFAQVTYQPPPAPQHVQRPVKGPPEVKSRNSIRLPLRAWTTSWWMLGFVCRAPHSALPVTTRSCASCPIRIAS